MTKVHEDGYIPLNEFGFKEHTFKHYHPDLTGIKDVKSFTGEPMLFGADLGFARAQGGMLTRDALHMLKSIESFQELYKEVEAGRKNLNIDTRVTQCMKGFLPSIGGWHCDEVPRNEQYSQPDLTQAEPINRHFMILMATTKEHSETEFVNEPFFFDIPEGGEKKVYAELERKTNDLIEHGVITTTKIELGKFYEFDQLSVHRPTPTINAGWRFFFRASISDRKNVNHIRKQVQVYIPQEAWSW